MVVRLEAGRDPVRSYVAEQAAQGLDYVRALVVAADDAVLALIDDLTEAEGTRVTAADEWSVFDVLRHIGSSLDRSRTRIETLASGQPFANPAVAPGQMQDDYATFEALRSAYRDSMAAIIGVLSRVQPERGLDLTADHALFGPFNWLEWAVYSHHVHTHDHIGQIAAVRAALKQPAS